MKMGKFKIGIEFDIQLLKALKDNNNSGVEIQNSIHHLALHPIHLNNLNKSIKDLLSRGIAKYNKNLGGILLGYQNIKLPEDIGLINYDSCYIHLDLEADFFVFKPEIGKDMQGIVNRKSKDHVGLLVYNVFNVSIPELQENDKNWLGSTVNIGDEVLFMITYIDLSSYLPYIRGKLISVISEVNTGVNDIEEKCSKNKKKLNKKIIFDDEPSPKETPVSRYSEEPRRRKKERFRKKKSNISESSENGQNNSLENLEQENLFSKRKNSKCHNELNDNRDNNEETKKRKKNKEKVKKENNKDESSNQDLNLSELFNGTALSVENIKTEIDSDENLKSNASKKKHSRKLENDYVYQNNSADDQTNKRHKQSKKKKEKLKEEEQELPINLNLNSHSLENSEISYVSLDKVKCENSDSNLEYSPDNLNSKKLKKRKRSLGEMESPLKKRKRKSA